MRVIGQRFNFNGAYDGKRQTKLTVSETAADTAPFSAAFTEESGDRQMVTPCLQSIDYPIY